MKSSLLSHARADATWEWEERGENGKWRDTGGIEGWKLKTMEMTQINHDEKKQRIIEDCKWGNEGVLG